MILLTRRSPLRLSQPALFLSRVLTLIFLWLIPTLLHGGSPHKHPPEGPQLVLVVSLLWYGDHLFESNLQTIDRLRKDIPGIKFWHFISPNYFLGPTPAEIKRRAQTIQSRIQPGDHQGILLEARPALAEKAGVLFRSNPSFYRGENFQCSENDPCEHDSMLSVYPIEDIMRLIRQSQATLDEQGFLPSKMFMTRFWENSPNIAQAAIQLGLEQDHSAIPPSRVKKRLQYVPGYTWIRGAWSRLDEGLAQPYHRKFRHSSLLTVPISGGLIDYATPGEIQEILAQSLTKARQEKRAELVFQVAFHQETADIFRPRLEKTLQAVNETASKKQVAVSYDPPKSSLLATD